MTPIRQLSDAVWSGDLATIESLLEAGVDVNASDERRDPPLHLAIEQQRLDIVQRLIEAGADVNREVRAGWTPLAHAIDVESDAAWQAHQEPGHESTDILEVLLAAGAQPSSRAFEVAEEWGNQKALALLRRSAGGGIPGRSL